VCPLDEDRVRDYWPCFAHGRRLLREVPSSTCPPNLKIGVRIVVLSQSTGCLCSRQPSSQRYHRDMETGIADSPIEHVLILVRPRHGNVKAASDELEISLRRGDGGSADKVQESICQSEEAVPTAAKTGDFPSFPSSLRIPDGPPYEYTYSYIPSSSVGREPKGKRGGQEGQHVSEGAQDSRCRSRQQGGVVAWRARRRAVPFPPGNSERPSGTTGVGISSLGCRVLSTVLRQLESTPGLFLKPSASSSPRTREADGWNRPDKPTSCDLPTDVGSSRRPRTSSFFFHHPHRPSSSPCHGCCDEGTAESKGLCVS
jgi:hypothetical protein